MPEEALARIAMQDKIDALKAAIAEYSFTDKASLDAFRSQFTGRKGAIQALFKDFKSVPNEQKAAMGQALNALKQFAQAHLEAGQEQIAAAADDTRPHDLSLPADPFPQGSRHPLLQVQRKIVAAFERLGFAVARGPEVESDWYNFSALNFPANHPARAMQDTFFVTRDPDFDRPTLGGEADPNAKLTPEDAPQDVVLRTHTSSVQVRVMEDNDPPIRIIAPGRVYRNEAVTARAHCFFHQIEGLYIDKGVSFADLKQTLLYFVQEIFGKDTKIRLRPSYFPFTEVSAEMDISCLICGGEGCRVCKHTGWVEVLGCGMVDPNVLRNCGIDPETYSGFAFGMGVERVTQLLYRVPDLRLYSQNDVRFLRQFQNFR